MGSYVPPSLPTLTHLLDDDACTAVSTEPSLHPSANYVFGCMDFKGRTMHTRVFTLVAV